MLPVGDLTGVRAREGAGDAATADAADDPRGLRSAVDRGADPVAVGRTGEEATQGARLRADLTLGPGAQEAGELSYGRGASHARATGGRRAVPGQDTEIHVRGRRRGRPFLPAADRGEGEHGRYEGGEPAGALGSRSAAPAPGGRGGHRGCAPAAAYSDSQSAYQPASATDGIIRAAAATTASTPMVTATVPLSPTAILLGDGRRPASSPWIDRTRAAVERRARAIVRPSTRGTTPAR